jgi:GNAT superfamily N-acetyltransferase
MIKVLKTDATNQDFITLVKLLDADLAIRDGDDHAFYNQFNRLDMIKHVIVLYQDGEAICCGALKSYDHQTMELKRMYTSKQCRGQGMASSILHELESWAIELGYTKLILETGVRQPEAIGLYKKCGFQQITNYGQYKGLVDSLCFEKLLVNPA